MLNPRDTATILAALRYWQQETNDHMIERAYAMPDQFDEGKIIPLNNREIDALCQRLNRKVVTRRYKAEDCKDGWSTSEGAFWQVSEYLDDERKCVLLSRPKEETRSLASLFNAVISTFKLDNGIED